MLWLFRFLNGEVCISLSGERAEELLSRLASNGILLRRIHYRKKEILAWMDLSAFRALRRYRKGTGVRVAIRRKTGLPFLLFRYRGRYGIAVGLVCFAAVIGLLSRFVWDVRVTGDHTVPEEEILSDASELGLKIGQPLRLIDVKNDAQRLMLRNGHLAWASVNQEGCFLEINVSEIKNAVPEDHGEPCNLYATADGIVRRLDIRSGTPCVKVGDAVGKGDLLVNGIVELLGSTTFVQAVGTVTAQVEREITAEHPVCEVVAVPTGKIKKHSVIGFFGIRLPCYLGDFPKQGKYEYTEKRLKMLGRSLPIEIKTQTWKPLCDQRMEYSRDQLETMLKKQIDGQVKRSKNESCRVISEHFTMDGETAKMTSKILCEENIAVSRRIGMASSETEKTDN